jgi:hypothetical protein
MLVDSSNTTSGSADIGAIRQAAQATGTSFQYLLATAQVESGLNPQAGASTSSARGLFQFIEQTWLATMKQSGTSLGYGQYADAITKTASGKYEVRDPAVRSDILKLRNDRRRMPPWRAPSPRRMRHCCRRSLAVRRARVSFISPIFSESAVRRSSSRRHPIIRAAPPQACFRALPTPIRRSSTIIQPARREACTGARGAHRALRRRGAGAAGQRHQRRASNHCAERGALKSGNV